MGRALRSLRAHRMSVWPAPAQRLRDAGIGPSMGSVGDAYDNAVAESVFATRKAELLPGEV